MMVLGLCFAGSATKQRGEMSEFLASVLGLRKEVLDGASADFFPLPDGSYFAVAAPGEMGETRRFIGFLVDNLGQAIAELVSRGVQGLEPAEAQVGFQKG